MSNDPSNPRSQRTPVDPVRVTRRLFMKTSGTTLVALGAGLGVPAPRAWAARSIVIGHQADMTGVLAYAGFWNDRLARAAIRKINEAGGVGGAELVLKTEDTETDAKTGLRKMRKLVEQDRVDFVIGSNHSGVAFASIPIARDARVPYWAIARSREVTGKRGNRYVFKAGGNVAQEAEAMVNESLVKEMGKNWVLFFEDYAWGHSHRDEWTSRLKALGAKITHIPTPLGTSDYVPYLLKVPSDTTAVFAALLGADLVGFAKQFRDLNLASRIKAVAPMVTGITSPDAWANARGFLVPAEMPIELKSKDTPHIRKFRELIGMDQSGRAADGDRYPAENYANAWETIHWIKLGIEKSGWKGRKDTPDLIKALEGMSVAESLDFPQGAKTMRAEDHQVFLDHYLRRIGEGGAEVIERVVPKADCTYAPDVDYRKESF